MRTATTFMVSGRVCQARGDGFGQEKTTGCLVTAVRQGDLCCMIRVCERREVTYVIGFMV